MAKELRCKDLGMDCAVVMQADTEAELLKQDADHAKKVHHLTTMDDKMMAKVQAAIHDTKPTYDTKK
jgi:predicted small metal-binding protein